MNPHDPYWQHDFSLGERVFFNVPQSIRRGIRMLLHVATQHHLGNREPVDFIVSLPHPSGERTYVHARPYIMRPVSWLDTIIRRVLHSPVPAMPYQELGNCQAWYYHTDRLLLLWECYVYEDVMSANDPRTDPNLPAIWNGFEQFLLAQFPETAWIATPSWEPLYALPDWQAFLTRQGYRPFNTQAFLKEVHRT